jgi:hypothetical protein
MSDAGNITIEVFDAHEVLLGCVTANREDIRRGSALFRRVLDSTLEVQIQLHCSSLAVVQRYVNCISPEQLIGLPGDIENGLIELYCFAAQLQDGYVRRLVLDRWQQLSDQNAELELKAEDLNPLFDSTDCDDPARDFWAATVYAAGVADQILKADRCHEALIAKLLVLVASGDMS